MLKLIFYIIWVANIILVVLKRKSKFLSALSFVLSFVVLAGNTYNLDYMTYYWSYTHQDFDTLDKGYQLLCRISSNAYGTSKYDVDCFMAMHTERNQ